MATRTTAGSGGRSQPDGSSASRSRPTGRPTGSASSEQGAAPRRAARRRDLFAFDRTFGTRLTAGADEAGRGCLAGPIVAAAVVLDCEQLARTPSVRAGLSELDDSKRHTAATRGRLYPLIIAAAVRVQVVSRCAQTIDADGLHVTNLAVLAEALRGAAVGLRGPLSCLVDGFALPGLERSHEAVLGGDGKSAAIAAASIVAKVTRDRMMARADAVHPGWSFARHVGYATAEHREAIERLGVTPLHRMSFRSAAYLRIAS